jgi:hypothetical protein
VLPTRYDGGRPLRRGSLPARQPNPIRPLRFRVRAAAHSPRNTRSPPESAETRQDEVDTSPAIGRDAFGDLLGRSDQPGSESVVVLHQIVERRIGPPAFSVPGRGAGLPHGGAESVDGRPVALATISRNVSFASASVSLAMMNALVVPVGALLDVAGDQAPPLTLGTQWADVARSAMRSVVVVVNQTKPAGCGHSFNSAGRKRSVFPGFR